jgi:Icc protein
MMKKDKPADALDEHGARRRTVLSCMAWAGAGMLWTMNGGVPGSRLIGGAQAAEIAAPDLHAFSFVQISDSHIGFSKDPNLDPASTMQQAVNTIRTMPQRPAFIVHTGDISQSSKSAEFDTATQIAGSAGLDVHYVPGEHDVLGGDGTTNGNGDAYFQRFSGQTARKAYSFDQGGVHFVALTNVLDLKGDGLGYLGDEQLTWLEQDLRARTSSTPVVVFAHIPLWSLYPQWGWATQDSARALELMKRFGSVTVLNGHVHQVAQKVEGEMTFYTAMSTAFPQPAPGAAQHAGPMSVPASELKHLLGIRTVNYVPENTLLAVVDAPLQS